MDLQKLFCGHQAENDLIVGVFYRIIPQAVCARHGLAVGAIFAWPVRILIWLMVPVAWPIAKLLDFALGHKQGVIYRRAGMLTSSIQLVGSRIGHSRSKKSAELKELVALHGEDQAGPLTKDEVSIVRAVLDLRDKTVKDVMTPLEHVFMLPLETQLNRTTIEQVNRAPINHFHSDHGAKTSLHRSNEPATRAYPSSIPPATTSSASCSLNNW